MRAKHSPSAAKRIAKTRAKIARLKDKHRICVRKTSRHIYAQLIAPGGGTTLAAASTLGKSFSCEGDKKAAAYQVGERMAAKVKACGVLRVAFDRSGFQYHGRIRALAEALRANGIEF